MANPFASGGRTAVAYVFETEYGVTPTTPQMILLPKSSLTLEPNIEEIEDDTITGDLMGTETRNGNYNLGGDLTASLRHGQFDPWFEAALGGTWTANVVKGGAVERSMTVEKQQLDIGAHDRYRGVRIDGFNMNFEQGQIVKVAFQLMGAGFSSSGTLLDATPTAELANKRVMSHNGGTITLGSSPDIVCTAATLNFTRSQEYGYAYGSSEAFDIIARRLLVTGSLTAYFRDNTERNLWLAETYVPLSIMSTDGTNSLTFNVPRAKLTAVGRPVPGDGFVMQNITYRGEKDPTAGTVLQITRTAL